MSRTGDAPIRFSLLVTLVLIAPVSLLALSDSAQANTSRGPIVIESDRDFTSTNGVVGGSGTSADPYVISGWDFAGPTDPAISIRGTRKWFVIRDLTTTRGGYYEGYRGGGIRLVDVQNGRIENVILQGTSVGVSVEGSSKIHLFGIVLLDSSRGITILNSNDVSVGGARMPAGWPFDLITAISLGNVRSAIVANNVITSSIYYGIEVYSSAGILLENNTISGTGSGILVKSQDGGVIIRNNSVFQNSGGDIVLEGSTNIMIEGNRLASNGSSETGLVVRGDLRANYDSHDISADNLVRGMPLLVALRCSGLVINGAIAGQIYITSCTDVKITNLTMAVAGTHLVLMFVDRATIRDSTFRNSTLGGASEAILLRHTSNTSVFHNNFIHTGVSDQAGRNNRWDDGYPSGGNYYWAYSGPDRDGDGIGDEPQRIFEDAVDRYPLMQPYGIPAEPPVVTFALNPTTVSVNEGFYFDGTGSWDPDGRLVTGQWTFGDGFAYAFPGIVAGSYAYQLPGTYTITLTATDNSGLPGSHSQQIVVTPYVPPTPPLPSIGKPRVVEYLSDFRIPVPADWPVQFDVTVNGQKIDLVAFGPTYNQFDTNLLVVSESDGSIRETRAFLEGFLNGVVAGIQSSDPSAFLDGSPEFRAVSNHSAVSFVVRYPTLGVVQRFAAVVSESHHRLWAIALSFDQGLSVVLDPLFVRILDGFEITAAIPPSSLPPILAIVGIAVVAIATLVFIVRLRRKRRGFPRAGSTEAAVPSLTSGASKIRSCPRCRTTVEQGSPYCTSCGFVLRSPSGVRGPPYDPQAGGRPPST